MTRRGPRSQTAIRRRFTNWNRRLATITNGNLGGVIRWERRHATEMHTDLVAYCGSCWEQRVDVGIHTCNARHADGRRQAELVMLAVASYGSCKHCGYVGVGDIRTSAEMGTPGVTHLFP